MWPILRGWLFSTVLVGLLAAPAVAAGADADSWYEEGRQVFFDRVRSGAASHPRRAELSAQEIAELGALATTQPRLYDQLANLYFQKDELEFWALLDSEDDDSKAALRERCLDLATFAADQFVDALFLPGPNAQWIRGLLAQFRGKDRVELVIASSGLLARVEPTPPPKAHPLSPEFERQWGLAAARFPEAHAVTRGRDVRIAVIDSGIDDSHPVFATATMGRHFGLLGRTGPPWASTAPPTDWGGHGTVVSSIVVRYAPDAEVTMYRCNDSDTMNNAPYPLLLAHYMAACIYKAVHDGNDVINISAGIPLRIPYLEAACRYAYDNNVIVLAGGPYSLAKYLGTNDSFPASFETTIGVTGIARRDDGSYGVWDTAAAEGANDVAAPNAPFAASPTYLPGQEDRYAPGTSCATPIAAAAFGLVASVLPRTGLEGPGEYVETVKRVVFGTANSKLVGFDGFAPEIGAGVVDAAAAVTRATSLKSGNEPLNAATVPLPTTTDAIAAVAGSRLADLGRIDLHWGQTAVKLDQAQRATRGAGVRVAVIGSGVDSRSELAREFEVDRERSRDLLDTADARSPTQPTGTVGAGTIMAAIVAAYAPEAEIVAYRVTSGASEADAFAVALRTSRAIRDAVAADTDIIVVGPAFDRDFDFLAEACAHAYRHNVVLVAPTRNAPARAAASRSIFPAHYSTVLGVAGVVPAGDGKATWWEGSGASNFNALAAPALVTAAGDAASLPPSNAWAAAATAGIAALLVSRLEPTENELDGQYVQRVFEVLTRSADARALGAATFSPRFGYGLIDASAALGPRLAAYLHKMKGIEDEFSKRLAQVNAEQDKRK
jgi:hypothetical protein